MAVTTKIGPLEVGAQRLIVNCSDYSYDKVEALREDIANIRRANSIFSKHPMKEGEKKDDWRARN